ncbi:hypothetical protein [Amycolatopsis regifaucium]|uniref:DUF3592 domain-containing protein n=1 Tax=Amycolatopsis regifaucium TaxID=546365 RepID=A0A154MN63_9PSEU|nr:hypothetical protein [Amycolatopsis regifaucium]KZB85666.1 hypothetical protein AVL48_29860 [Amycolatopsis regifaucium]OKA10580.1 hypothetical protein ATP06_0204050 [Amycolatopsis regifaucium]SFI82932.1 hypothetical protein SAMN04489731_113181 [Amycolatopsis regifaucium]
MLVIRLLATLLWFGIPAGILAYAVHDLNVRDAPTSSIEGTVIAHRQETYMSSQDPEPHSTYFITVRGAAGDFEFGNGRQAIDTEPGTPVVVQVSTATGKIVFLRKGATVVDLRNTVNTDVILIVFAAVGLLIALVRELVIDDYTYPRWLGFVFGTLAVAVGGWVALMLAG